MAHQDARWVELAQVVRPHGVHGELRVKLYNSASTTLLETRSVRVRPVDGQERDVPIAGARQASHGIVLLTLDGIDDRDAAESMRNAVLSVRRELLPPPEDGEFYVCDILGASVTLHDGTAVGSVVDFRSYPGADVIVVEGAGKRYEVPLVEDFVKTVDTEAKSVVLLGIDGLEST